MATQVSRRQAWVIAARPQTLPAAAAPVIVGVGLALDAGVFAPLPALAALIGAALIQIGTNFANDYYDAIQGADTDDREGFTRVVASGLIDPGEVKRAMWLTFAAAIVVGTFLVAVGGVPILVIGLASVAAGIAYTGGPYPLGYHGLGDVFVFVFFGVIAVTGTYYVQAAALTGGLLPLAPPPGTLTSQRSSRVSLSLRCRRTSSSSTTFVTARRTPRRASERSRFGSATASHGRSTPSFSG